MRKRFWISLLCLAVIALWGFYENTLLMQHEITVASPELPESFDGLRIAHVSDLHNTRFGKGNERLLELLRNAQPDIIAITGDLIDANHTDIDTALAFVSEAAKIAPCYYVTGNHEQWFSGYATFEEQLCSTGITVLKNTALPLERDGQSILLAGVDDPAFLGDSRFFQKLEQLATEDYCILLSHRPEYFDAYCQAEFDLVLSGHAHGGQFRLPFLGGIVAPGQGFFPEYDAGVYTAGHTAMAVSRGLGNSVIPIRLGNRPEILLITLIHQ